MTVSGGALARSRTTTEEARCQIETLGEEEVELLDQNLHKEKTPCNLPTRFLANLPAERDGYSGVSSSLVTDDYLRSDADDLFPGDDGVAVHFRLFRAAAAVGTDAEAFEDAELAGG
jgi:hypothetical protein